MAARGTEIISRGDIISSSWRSNLADFEAQENRTFGQRLSDGARETKEKVKSFMKNHWIGIIGAIAIAVGIGVASVAALPAAILMLVGVILIVADIVLYSRMRDHADEQEHNARHSHVS
jgi:hypothetical protein